MTSMPAATAKRRGWALPLLVLFLIALPITEVWLLIKLGHAIGGLPTVGLLILEALLGAWLIRHEGRRAWKALREAVSRGSLPVNEATDAALVLVGGVFLMLPGLITDAIGAIFLLPFTRPLARRLVQLFIAKKTADLASTVGAMQGRMNLDGQTIPGSVVDDTPASTKVAPQLNRLSDTTDDAVVSGEILD